MSLRICLRSLQKERLSYSYGLSALHLHTPRESVYGKQYVGMVEWLGGHSIAPLRRHKHGEINFLDVAEKFRRQGIGKYLIDLVVHDLKSNKTKQLVVVSAPKLVEFWSRNGFQPIHPFELGDCDQRMSSNHEHNVCGARKILLCRRL